MRSNTKLNSFDKKDLKIKLAMFANSVYSYDFAYNEDMGITVLIVTPFKNSNTCHIATAIMSPDETKFRPSVGRYFAFNNYIAGKYIDTPAMVNVSIFDHL
jgi:hypothetical protein